MTAFVLDCSIALSWLVPDEASPTTARLLDAVVADGASVPAIWPAEVANGLLMAQRRGRLTEAQRQAASRDIGRLPIEVDLPALQTILENAGGLAASHDLTAYDATYLELALRRGLPLATLDRTLRTAALRARVELLPG